MRGDRPLNPDLDLLHRLARQVHRGFARGSEIQDAGAFRLYLWPRPEPFYRNRALPVAVPADWRAAVDVLIAAFATAGREPRLEFFAELWPGLPAALEAAGFRLEMEAPVHVLTQAPADGSFPGAELLGPGTVPALIESFLGQAQAAFDMPLPPDPAELAQFRHDLEQGATLAAAVLEDSQPVAGACLIGLGAEAELAGVWTNPHHRRRGHGLAVCAALARAFFATGGEIVWLSAAGDAAESLYRKLGFARVGTQLNYALPERRPPLA